VVRAADLLVSSLEGLDVLILLAREPMRGWTAHEITARLRLPPRKVERELERMRARGLLARETDIHRFAPEDGDLADAVAELLAAYETRRIELINHVAGRALDRILLVAGGSRRRGSS
jgi:predicted transcriptional regulator